MSNLGYFAVVFVVFLAVAGLLIWGTTAVIKMIWQTFVEWALEVRDRREVAGK